MAREALLRERGLRHPALTRQRESELGDLIVALIMATHIWNDRPAGAGTLAASTKMTAEDLAVYLGEYSVDEISSECERLLESRILMRAKKRSRGGDLPAFDIGPGGYAAYDSAVAKNLNLAKGESILDRKTRSSIVIFNAWQSEYNPSRSKIDDALERVVEEINGSPNLWRPLKIEQATAPGDGALRIDVALQGKIKAADFFVGDMTAVHVYDDRMRANENVLVEVGFALASKEPSEVILLAQGRDDLPGIERAKPAFDIAHVRRLAFETPSDLRAKLATELRACLRKRGWLQ